MQKVNLGFKAFDCHELLCHAVAQTAGLYQRFQLDVSLLDTSFMTAGTLPPRTFLAACAAALVDWYQGADYKIVFVACCKPMFWLYGDAATASLQHLDNARIATYPDAAPPAKFLRHLLAENAVQATLLPARDDVARLGLLRSGSVHAALLSSCNFPSRARQLGLTQLAFLGDNMKLPTTGLSVSGELCDNNPELVLAMVAAQHAAIELVYRDDELLSEVLAKDFLLPEAELAEAMNIVRENYNEAGFCDPMKAAEMAEMLMMQTGPAARDPAAAYDFRFLLPNAQWL